MQFQTQSDRLPISLSTPLLNRVYQFARQAHKGQVRKYTGESYVRHCVQVADLVGRVSQDEELKAAALLHDTVEDTGVMFVDIDRRFGSRICDLVGQVTDVSIFHGTGLNRRDRKKMDREHLSYSTAAGATLKLADLIDNTQSITRHDPKFAAVYMREKAQLLEVLRHGHPLLLTIAENLVDDYHKGHNND